MQTSRFNDSISTVRRDQQPAAEGISTLCILFLLLLLLSRNRRLSVAGLRQEYTGTGLISDTVALSAATIREEVCQLRVRCWAHQGSRAVRIQTHRGMAKSTLAMGLGQGIKAGTQQRTAGSRLHQSLGCLRSAMESNPNPGEIDCLGRRASRADRPVHPPPPEPGQGGRNIVATPNSKM
jgi:hypothetical protein